MSVFSNLIRIEKNNGPVAKQVDAADLKSAIWKRVCRFDSGRGHHFLMYFLRVLEVLQFKPLRYFGIILLLGSFAFVGGYIYYVRNSGELIATAAVTKKTPSPDLEELKINLKTYRYYDLEFEPLHFTNDMKDLKITLIVKNGDAIDVPKAARNLLIGSKFHLINKKTSQIVLEKSGWTTQPSNHMEGRFNENTFFVLGYISPPENGEYVLSVKNLIFVETSLLAASKKEFYLEIKSGALDLKIEFLLYALLCLFIGAIILIVTKPKNPNYKARKKFYK